jgi:hypothetical protein
MEGCRHPHLFPLLEEYLREAGAIKPAPPVTRTFLYFLLLAIISNLLVIL